MEDGFKLFKLEDGSEIKAWFELGDKIDVKVAGSVTYTLEKGYLYGYTLFSSTKSIQNVWRFRVIVSNEKLIGDVKKPAGWYEPGIAPKGVGFLPHLQKIAWVSWGAPDEVEIKPGSSATGFKFNSPLSLPGIVDYYVEGWHKAPWFPEGMAPNYVPGYHDLTPYGPGIVGKTIGPVPPPEVFKPVEFLDHIIRLKEEAASFGWIKEKGIKQSLNAKLKNVKAALERNQIRTAKNILNAFINELEAQKDRHINSEAYGVLRFNAEYLMDNL